MALYSYKGLDRGGQEQKGLIEADNAKDATRMLRDRAIYVLDLKEGDGAAGGGISFLKKWIVFLLPHRWSPVGSGDLIIFFRQISLMLRAGYTLVKALEMSSEMVANMRLRLAINRMSNEIRRGASFSSQLEKEKRTFSPMMANLVASGEQSGSLDSILERLAEGLERGKELKRQLMAALIYPAFIVLASVAVVAFLVMGVIPRFARFLEARRAELPNSTQMLMDISDWFFTWGSMLAGGFAVFVFVVLAAYTTGPGKRLVDRCFLAIPLIGTAIAYASMAQAGWSLSMLLQSGITALESLRITCGVVNNRAVADCFGRAAEELLAGRSLSKTFEQPFILPMMRHMAAVGESSGQLDAVMGDVGEYYQKELSAKVKLITVSVEPTLILMVGGMVGFVYYAFFQAVMTVSKGGM